MSRAEVRHEAEPGVLTPELVALMGTIATRVASAGPQWCRAEVASVVRVAMVSAWQGREVQSVGALWTVARRAAHRACAEESYSTGTWHARTNAALGLEPAWRFAVPGQIDGHVMGDPAPPTGELGPLLDELVDQLDARGMPQALAEEAVLTLVDYVCTLGVRRTYDLRGEAPSHRAGIDPMSWRALVVLVVGTVRARNGGPHPGLLARHAAGEDVWSDPRVLGLVDEVVNPRRRCLRYAWSEPPGEQVA